LLVASLRDAVSNGPLGQHTGYQQFFSAQKSHIFLFD
jgi:hypothetical protein